MPGYISKSGLIYSDKEVAEIISRENWVRPPDQPVKDSEIPMVIERYEQEKNYGDTSGRN